MSKVGVVIPCYNDGVFLREALESVRTGEHIGEVVIVNDGSTDATTLSVLEALRVEGCRILDTTNNGLAAARNNGWRALSSAYVLFLDADNFVDPDYAEKAAKVLDADPRIGVVFGDRQEFGSRDTLVEQRVPTLAEELVGNRIDACAVVRRSLLERSGGFDESILEGYEDWEFWIRLMGAGEMFHHLSGTLFHYRVREGSLLSKAADPEIRRRIVERIVAKHRQLYTASIDVVVPELHQIQAADQARLRAVQAAYNELVLRSNELSGRSGLLSEELALMRSDRERVAREWGAERSDLRMRIDASAKNLERAEVERVSLERSIGELETGLATLRKEKEELAAEAHRLVGETDKLQQALQVHREHSKALQGMIGQYEARIKAIESSKLWRLRKGYNKMRALLRTSSGSSSTGFRWIKRVTFLVSHNGRRIVRRFLAKFFRAMYLMTEDQPVRIVLGDEQQRTTWGASDDPYEQWMAAHFARSSDLDDQREQAQHFNEKPLVSVVMPVYDPPIALLDAAIRSVVAQSYGNWELCIADDRSPNKDVRKFLEEWKRIDERIRVVFRKENGHISKASNSALELVTGTFIAFMDHDDLLAPDAVFHIVKRINRKPDVDILYTDEDKVDESGKHSDAHFKPQWCPDHLLSRNYFGHLVVMRTELVQQIGGFREGFEGSQDYDLILRATERSRRIEHIPRVLYHWRIHAASAALNEEVKPYAYEAARKAISESLIRRGEPAEVGFLDGYRGYSIKFETPLRGKVSVIIPTKDQAAVLATCLHSVFDRTQHPDFEVIVLSNNSKEEGLFALMQKMEQLHPEKFRWYRSDEPFNFSALMNYGLSKATGEHILYLNNDTEIIHRDWMSTMHSWSQRPSIGAVGVKLLYHNDTIQHAGVVIGLGGVAGHTFVGQHRDGPGYFNYINTVNNNSAVTAACMMVERRKLEQIGGWEELFTVEYNDVDLCLRLREAGYDNVYLPDVAVYHYESLTRGHPHMTKESYERHLREVGLFKDRWAKYIADDPCYNPNLTRGAHDFRLA